MEGEGTEITITIEGLDELVEALHAIAKAITYAGLGEPGTTGPVEMLVEAVRQAGTEASGGNGR